MDYLMNTIVSYDNGIMCGKAKVVGIASNAMPIIGKTYILEDLSDNIPCHEYQYSHFVCSECHMKMMSFENDVKRKE